MDQKAWEEKLDDLEFGLLDAADEAKLREEIAQDPELTRLYELVRSRHQSLQRAAKLSAAPIPLETPVEVSPPPPKRARWWQSPIVLAASILIALAVGEQVWYESHSSVAAEKELRLTLVAPAQKELESLLPVALAVDSLTAKNLNRIPITFNILRDENGDFTPLSGGTLRTDRRGAISLVQCDSAATETKISARTPRYQQIAETVTPSIARKKVSRLTTDRGVYRPGENLLLRGLTLNLESLDYDGLDQSARFQVIDADGKLLWSAESDVADTGVSSDSWPIPADLPEGQYFVAIQPTKDTAAVDRRPITIERFETPRLRMKLDLPSLSFRAGASVEGSILIQQPTGEPVANHEVAARLVQNEVVLSEKVFTTDPAGNSAISLPLPHKLLPGAVEIIASVTVDGKTESTTQPVPIRSREVDLAFFPESGPLVAGIENRVFFQARDVNDEPVRARGHILDSTGKQVASFEASITGRGSLTMTPKEGERYSIELVGPTGLLPIRPFPEVSREVALLRPTEDVFDSDSGLYFDLPSSHPGQRVLLVATCRGAVVGLAAGLLGESVQIALVPSASGVIKVTLYDRIEEPRRPIAERLVFRRPRTQLAIEPNVSAFEGKGVLTLFVKDQTTNRPIDGANVGVSLVDQRFIDRDPKTRPTLASHFLILSAIRSPEDFESVDISLAPEPEAERELDMVLATHGWRTFASMQGPLPDEPKLVVTQSKSVDDPAKYRDEIDQRHRLHVRLLWGIAIAAALSFAVSSALRKMEAPAYAGPLFAFTIILLVMLTVSISNRTERDKSAPAITESTDQPSSPAARDQNQADAAGLAMARAEPEAAVASEENLASKVENAPSPVPAAAMRKSSSQDSDRNNAALRETATDAAVEVAPQARAAAPVAEIAAPTPAKLANEPLSAPPPPPPGVARIFSPLRYRSFLLADSKQPTILWVPTGITDDEGKLRVAFGPPTEPGPYLLSVDVHTRDGSLGSIRQEIRLP